MLCVVEIAAGRLAATLINPPTLHNSARYALYINQLINGL